MIGIGRTRQTRLALALAVSLVCVFPGRAAPSEPSRAPGPGGCCDVTGTYEVRFRVKLDPSGHHAFVQLEDGRIIVIRVSDGTYEIRGNRSAIITAASSSIVHCGLTLANGRGTVAGFPNVTGRYKDVVVTDDDIGGLLELGIGGELPGGQAICYEFSGQRDSGVPDPGAALVDLVVRFTLRLAKQPGATNPRPGFFFGFGSGFSRLGQGRFVYTGDGTGGFVRSGELPIVTGQEPVAAVPLDRAGGGPQDIAMISRTPSGDATSLNYFTQRSTGAFDRTQSLTLSVQYNARDVFIGAGDLTGDGASDVVIASESGRVDAFRLDGGGFTVSQSLDLGLPIVGMLPELVDLNGDGLRDAALATQQLDQERVFMSLLNGDGAGGVTPGPVTSDLFCLDSIFASPFRIAAGDLNRDGLIDLVVGGRGGACPTVGGTPNVVSMLNRLDQPGTFVLGTRIEVPQEDEAFQLTLFTPPCAGTLAVVANGGVFVGDGNGGFIDSGVRFSLGGIAPATVLSGDVNGDGIVDLVSITNQDSGITFQTLSLEPFAGRPLVSGVRVVGKNLVVDGGGFPEGSTILVDGVAYRTKPDRGSPSTTLTSKKALKKIPAGSIVTVQVRTPDGVVSDGTVFQR